MKRLLAIALACAFSCCLHAQVVDTTVCEILKNPQSFNGKIVRVKGTVAAGFDQFVVKGAGCGQSVNGIWLSYPEGTKGKAGPAAILQLQPARNFAGTAAPVERTPVSLDKNKDFKQFDSLLSTPYKSGGLCLGCTRYEVSATLVGRLDGAEAGVQRGSAGKIVAIGGFGNLNAYSARLVLQSVSDLSPQEIDYSKSAAVTKGDSTQDSGGGDPVATAHQVARAFGPGNPLGEKLERAAAAFGKPGEDNGVDVGFGVANEATQKGDAKGQSDSPDGVLFNCTFDMARLKGNALSIAIAFSGTIIADLRDPQSNGGESGTYVLESDGWQMAAVSAIGNRLKTLTLPGSYLLWNVAWPPADRDKALNDAITSFIANQESFAR
ncbi:MAG: hypothetical protein ABSE99_14505 [Terracidiphilus sp.]|jgi:hypothetical protein